MLNNIWAFLVISGLLMAGLLGRITGDGGVIELALADAKKAVLTIALPLAGVMMFWLGLLRLLEKAGVLDLLTRMLAPVLRLVFSQVPRDHPAMNAMVMNLGANMLGLGNAATPLGLKAMGHLQELNPAKNVPSNAMCVFLALNTAGFSLIPMSSITYLTAAGVSGPTRVIIPTILATAFTTIIAVISCRLYEKLPRFAVRPEDLVEESAAEEAKPVSDGIRPISKRGWIALSALLAGFAGMAILELGDPSWRTSLIHALGMDTLFAKMTAAQTQAAGQIAAEPAADGLNWKRLMNSASALAIPAILLIAIGVALARGVKVYEEFVEGAKEGFKTSVMIIPYLVAILVAIGMFREAGGIEMVSKALKPALDAVGFPTELLPMCLVRPLSGSGTLGLFSDIVKEFGPDSLLARTAGTIFGSTETTFYVVAVYFGAVAVKRTRHAVPAGLIADVVGIIASVIICKMMFA